MTGGRSARASERGALSILSAVVFVGAIAGAASAASSTVPFIAPNSPPAYVPNGSTWVPRRDTLGTSDATPQSVGTLCKPNVGTPTSAPSGLDAAVSATNGLVVSNEGYWSFDRSNPAGCASVSVTTWDSTLSPPSGTTFSDPRVVYDTHASKFIVVLHTHITTVAGPFAAAGDYLWLVNFNSSAVVTGSRPVYDASIVPISAAAPEVLKDLSVGFDKDYWLLAYDRTSSGTLSGEVARIDKSSEFWVDSAVTVPAHTVAPLVLDTSTTDYFLAVDTTAKNQIWRIAPDFVTPGSTVTSPITVTAFDLPPTVTQSNGTTLAADDGNFHAPTIQIGTSLWNVHTVGVDGHARDSASTSSARARRRR